MSYKMTNEHKNKIGKANKKGRFVKCFNCGKEHWVMPHQENRNNYPRKYCGVKCFREYYKNNFARKGSDNYFWKNGGWAFLKREILKRDNWTCCKCGFRDKDIMQVDHIKEKSIGGKDEINNLQVLCPNCHAKKTYKFLRKKKLPYSGK